MPAPRIAIVGRPNVGKSSLLNLIAKERIAIVDPTPGVTRDRLSVFVRLDSPTGVGAEKPVEIVDTGGFGVYVAEGKRYDETGADLSRLTNDIERQIASAVEGADMILFAIDTQAGVTPADLEIAKLLREQKLGDRTRDGGLIPVHVIATKVDGPSWEVHAHEFAGLGFGEPMMVSSKTKYLRRVMFDHLYEILPEPEPEPSEEETGVKVAIIGKRNAGKSTLVNALAGEDRVIVSEIAGTTRDAIDVKFEFEGKTITAIDTAGLRRKKSFQDQIEWYAFERAQRAIQRADVVLMLIDATEKISQVDEQLAALVEKSYKPVALVVNKWDLAKGQPGRHGKPVSTEDYDEYLRKEIKGLRFAPISFMSAKNKSNLKPTLELALELYEQASTRISTGKLNRILGEILNARAPGGHLGSRAKIYFASQVKANPPTIVMIVNRPDSFTHNDERFLMNRLREELPFDEVPIRLILRARAQAERSLKKAGKSASIGRGLHEIDPETQQFVDDLDGVDAILAELPDDPDAYFDDV